MKLLSRIALICGLLFLLCPAVAAYTITSYDGSAVVDESGVCQITVQSALRFDEPETEFSFALGPGVSAVQCGSYGAKPHKRDGVTYLDFENEGGFSGDLTLTVSYRIRNTVETVPGGQRFSLPLLAAQEADLSALTYRLQMPAAFDAAPQFASGYLAEGVDNYMNLTVSDGEITAVMQQALMTGDHLSLTLELPAGYFALRNVAGRTVNAARYIVLACWLIAFVYWFFRLRYPLPRPGRQANLPPDANAGVLRYLIYGERPDLALMCAGWAASGYLIIQRERKQITLQRRMRMGNERGSYETKIFARLFERNATVTVGSRAWAAAERSTLKQARRFWRRRLFYRDGGRPNVFRAVCLICGAAAYMAAADLMLPSRAGRLFALIALTLVGGGLCWLVQQAAIHCVSRKAGRWIFGGLAALGLLLTGAVLAGTLEMMLAAAVLQLLAGAALIFGPKRSRNGLQILEQTLGLRRWLKSLRPDQARELHGQYFYQMLPNAEALGLGRRFAEAFAPECGEVCSWLQTAGAELQKDPTRFYDQFHRLIRAMHGEDRPTFWQRVGLRLLRLQKRRAIARRRRKRAAARARQQAARRPSSRQSSNRRPSSRSASRSSSSRRRTPRR